MAQKPRFLRSDTVRHSRLGKNRRKLQKWRRPRGRHSKIRRKRFGYPRAPTVGYSSPRAQAGKIQGLMPRLVYTLRDLDTLTRENIAVIARVGARKKLELLKYAEQKGLKVASASHLRGGSK